MLWVKNDKICGHEKHTGILTRRTGEMGGWNYIEIKKLAFSK
jgi:hypothetical protein